MTWVIEFLSEPPCQRLALTLLHFLWQGLAAMVLVIAAARLLMLRRGPPRYAAYLIAMLTMVVCPVVTFMLLGEPSEPPSVQTVVIKPRALPAKPPGSQAPPIHAAAPRPDEATAPPVLTAEPVEGVAGPPTPEQKVVVQAPRDVVSGGETARRYVSVCLPWVLMVWLVGVSVLSVRLLLGFAGAYRWRRRLGQAFR